MIARTPALRGGAAAKGGDSRRDGRPVQWLGATVKNVVGRDGVSAAGLPGEAGVLVVEAPADGPAAKAGLRKRDVILRLDGQAVDTVEDLRRLYEAVGPGRMAKLAISRDQRETAVTVAGRPSRYRTPRRRAGSRTGIPDIGRTMAVFPCGRRFDSPARAPHLRHSAAATSTVNYRAEARRLLGLVPPRRQRVAALPRTGYIRGRPTARMLG
jgi:membrane-associated protease RseP (regulator of RpoE activity)